MNILVLLIPVSLALGATAMGFYIWCFRNDQFEDPEGDAARILEDD